MQMKARRREAERSGRVKVSRLEGGVGSENCAIQRSGVERRGWWGKRFAQWPVRSVSERTEIVRKGAPSGPISRRTRSKRGCEGTSPGEESQRRLKTANGQLTQLTRSIDVGEGSEELRLVVSRNLLCRRRWNRLGREVRQGHDRMDLPRGDGHFCEEGGFVSGERAVGVVEGNEAFVAEEDLPGTASNWPSSTKSEEEDAPLVPYDPVVVDKSLSEDLGHRSPGESDAESPATLDRLVLCLDAELSDPSSEVVRLAARRE